MYLFATLVNQRLSTCKTIFLKKKRRKIENKIHINKKRMATMEKGCRV